MTLGRAARATAAVAAGLRGSASAPATASPPTCRTSRRRSLRSSPARRSARSGRLLARLRRAQRGRPVRPDRAEGAARGRRLPLRRPRLRPRADRATSSRPSFPSLEPVASARVPGRLGLGRRASSAGAARVRAAPVRPPALGALLVRHDRPPEGDRPRAGRDPARVPEEAAPLTSTRSPATGSSGSRRPAG